MSASYEQIMNGSLDVVVIDHDSDNLEDASTKMVQEQLQIKESQGKTDDLVEETKQYNMAMVKMRQEEIEEMKQHHQVMEEKRKTEDLVEETKRHNMAMEKIKQEEIEEMKRHHQVMEDEWLDSVPNSRKRSRRL